MRDNQKLEKHFTIHDIEPIERFAYKGFDVYISEGGPYFDKKVRLDMDFPNGWYESAYAIGLNEELLFYQPLLFDYMHDSSYTTESKRKMRILSAKKAAMAHLDEHEKLLNAEKIH